MVTKSNINFSYLIFLSIVAALGGFLFGYDAAVISGTVSQVSSQFQLDEIQTGWFVGCALIGSIIGVSFAGKMSDKYGRKITMLLAALFFTYFRDFNFSISWTIGLFISTCGNFRIFRCLSGKLSTSSCFSKWHKFSFYVD